jgi:simple sugar transport system ATP-binding protein
MARNGLPAGEPQAAAGPHPPAGPRFAAELRDITKIYPGSLKKANSHISLGLGKGEILCVVGENGAGKTTLMKILSGLEQPSSGSIFLNGKQARIDSPLTAKKLGIGMVHQHFMLFPEYTVAENILMGIEKRKWGIFCDTPRAEAAAAEVIKAHHFSIDPREPVRRLSIGEMQQVEICRILYRNADIIILDEPTSVLTEGETASLFTTLRALAASGKSLILITHKLREVTRISHRVAVLRRGELAGVRDTQDTDEREIASLMLGASGELFPGISAGESGGEEGGKRAEPVIVFDRVKVLRRGQKRPLLEDLSFSAHAGEILAFAGVGGNGLGVLEAVLGGFLHPASGTILHRGRDISRLNIRRLRNQGLAFVPADRLRVGSAAGVSLEENLIINRRDAFTRRGFLRRRAIREFARGLIARYRIAGQSRDPAASLSGGNLQKLILAREIDLVRDYMVFSEPTWGLDLASGVFVRREIAALREQGAAVLLISTNLDEILELADRIIVMYRGSIAGVFPNREKTRDPARSLALKEAIGECMQGLSRKAPEGA